MSEDKNEQADEPQVETGDSAAAAPPAVSDEKAPAASAPPQPAAAADSGKPAKKSSGGSSAVGWLALVLVLALAGGAGWSVMQLSLIHI